MNNLHSPCCKSSTVKEQKYS